MTTAWRHIISIILQLNIWGLSKIPVAYIICIYVDIVRIAYDYIVS